MFIQLRPKAKDNGSNTRKQEAAFSVPRAPAETAGILALEQEAVVRPKPHCPCEGSCPRCTEETNSESILNPGRCRLLNDPELRFFRPRIKADLSRVRVHDGREAGTAADALGAEAYTVENHIVLGRDQDNPHTAQGKKLLAHELAHVSQQTDGKIDRRIQRRIKVIDHNKKSLSHEAKWGEVVIGLFNTLCPDTTWSLDKDGVLKPADAKICESLNLAKSGTKVSCECVCHFLSEAGPHVNIVCHETENDTVDDTPDKGAKTYRIRLTGKEAKGTMGVSGSAPAQGSSLKELSDPPWLILGHELCGHAKTTYPYLQSEKKPGEVEGYLHETTEQWDKSAVDIENLIRKEHSQPGSDLGIRAGSFYDPDDNIHYGSVLRLPKSMQLLTFLRQLNVPVNKHKAKCTDRDLVYTECGNVPKSGNPGSVPMLERVVYYTGWGRHVPYSCLWKVFPEGTFFGIEGIFWHLTGKGDTKETIAAKWGVTIDKLNVANSVFNNGVNLLPKDAPLPENLSVVISYKWAPGTERYFLIKGNSTCER